ncbi:pentatricopeptide repeat-containing protein [Senna tora]|uniref:Pentatricopeptide repeat-containing protein n=1 Tax=Senna tora TaxID=362788 RepID=A0A834TMZ9_9FABA|nr:pentatricopeptide repeat-containing protein [Senna tora]
MLVSLTPRWNQAAAATVIVQAAIVTVQARSIAAATVQAHSIAAAAVPKRYTCPLLLNPLSLFSWHRFLTLQRAIEICKAEDLVPNSRRPCRLCIGRYFQPLLPLPYAVLFSTSSFFSAFLAGPSGISFEYWVYQKMGHLLLIFLGKYSSSFKLASTALAHLNSTTFSDTQSSDCDDETVSSSCGCSSNTPSSVCNSFELNPFKVVETLNRLQREPSLAWDFFQQVKKQGFQHNISTYGVLIRILCYWGMDTRLDSLFVDLIALSETCPTFEIQDLFEEVLEGLGVEGNQHLLLAFNTMVKTYVSNNRFDEAIDFLFLTRRRGIVPHVYTCNYLINRLFDHNKEDMAFSIYKQLKKLGLSPNDYTYTIVIKALCKRGKLYELAGVLHEMHEAGMPISSFCFSTYIEGLCNHHSPDLGYEVLQKRREENAPVDIYAYNAVIRGFCNEMKLDEAESVILYMEKHGPVPDVFSYCELIHGYCKNGNLLKAITVHDDMTSKDEVVYNVVLDALCKLGKVDNARELLEGMKGKHMVLDIKHYTTLIGGYCQQGKLTVAFDLFKEMKKQGFEPDVVTYNVLSSGLSKNGCAVKVIQFLGYMETQGVKPNSDTYKSIIEGLWSAGKVEEAEAFLEILEDKSVEIYSVMINKYCEANYIKKAYELCLRLSNQGNIVKGGSYFKLLSKLCSEGDTNRALMLLEKMRLLNVEPGKIMYCKVLAALCQAGKMRKARSLFDVLVERGITPDVITYTLMINSYCRMNCLPEAYFLFQDMKDRGIKPDVVTYTVLLDGQFKTNLSTNSSLMLNNGKTAISDVSTILREMHDMKVKPDVITYTVLIDGHVKAYNLQEEAIALFDEMIGKGLEPDNVAYNALVCGLCNRGNRNKPIMLLEDILSKGIAPDQYSISALERGKLSQFLFDKPEWDIFIMIDDWFTQNHTDNTLTWNSTLQLNRYHDTIKSVVSNTSFQHMLEDMASLAILDAEKDRGMSNGVLIKRKKFYRYNTTFLPDCMEYEILMLIKARLIRFIFTT